MFERIKQDKVKISIILIWTFAVCAIRILYYLFDYRGILDTYGYLDGALIGIEEGDHITTSGLSLAYTGALIRFLKLFNYSNRFIFGWQLFMETVALVLIFCGSIQFYDFKTAIYTTSLIAVSPTLIETVRICSPEEYFLFFFSIIYLILGIFSMFTRSHQWTRRTRNELLVLGMGIYIGMLIAWNYLGFLALIMFLIIVIRNFRLFKDKSWLQNLSEKGLSEEKQIMSVGGQTIIILLGSFIGYFFCMLKYTGYTGYGIVDQFKWWVDKFKTFPQRTMDFDTNIAFWFVCSILFGLVLNELFKLKRKTEENKQLELEEKNRAIIIAQEHAFVNRNLGEKKQGETDEFFITEDGRKVRYLENPMQGPKKKNRGDNRFDLNALAVENEKAIININPDNIVIVESEGMQKAKIGIEKVVKIPEIKISQSVLKELSISPDGDGSLNKEKTNEEITGENREETKEIAEENKKDKVKKEKVKKEKAQQERTEKEVKKEKIKKEKIKKEKTEREKAGKEKGLKERKPQKIAGEINSTVANKVTRVETTGKYTNLEEFDFNIDSTDDFDF